MSGSSAAPEHGWIPGAAAAIFTAPADRAARIVLLRLVNTSRTRSQVVKLRQPEGTGLLRVERVLTYALSPLGCIEVLARSEPLQLRAGEQLLASSSERGVVGFTLAARPE